MSLNGGDAGGLRRLGGGGSGVYVRRGMDAFLHTTADVGKHEGVAAGAARQEASLVVGVNGLGLAAQAPRIASRLPTTRRPGTTSQRGTCPGPAPRPAHHTTGTADGSIFGRGCSEIGRSVEVECPCASSQ